MPLRDDLGEGMIEVVLRIPNENGVIAPTDCDTLETETRFLIFDRDANRGIGELKHRLAFVTWVVPLGEGKYRLEDLWHGHPFRRNDEGVAPGGLAFRDVFLAKHLADGSLLFDRLVQKGEWRVDFWVLPDASFVRSEYLNAAVAKIEANGGCAEQDPWIRNWLWTFLPPETDYDQTSDIAQGLRRIPRVEIEAVQNTLLEQPRGSNEDPT
jgi:hypothetical protein